jgi:hypothetical protein
VRRTSVCPKMSTCHVCPLSSILKPHMYRPRAPRSPGKLAPVPKTLGPHVRIWLPFFFSATQITYHGTFIIMAAARASSPRQWRRWLPLVGATLTACFVATFLVLHGANEQEHFDFIIVGGGSSGSVVAGRLGQLGHTVLLLEAGGPTQQSLGGTQAVVGKWTIFDVPLAWVQVLSDNRWSKQFQWNVPADPPPAIARGLGGCGIHNAMLYMRGRPDDFASWGPGWSWSDVLPFYRRSITNRQFDEHGADGPVTVTSVPSDNISRAFVESCRTAGLRPNADFNGHGSRDGAGYYQFMIRDLVRDSPAAAFLGVRRRPPSVTIRTHAYVSRVLFDDDKRAWGVEYVRGKNPTNAASRLVAVADHEVILSAGCASAHACACACMCMCMLHVLVACACSMCRLHVPVACACMCMCLLHVPVACACCMCRLHVPVACSACCMCRLHVPVACAGCTAFTPCTPHAYDHA